MKQKQILIGLTGSIGMGKSATAKMFARLGAAVFEADKEIHRLLKPEGAAFKKVAAAFPDAVVGGKISRKKLGATVFQNKTKREKLEAILHPLLWREREKFLKRTAQKKKKAAVLDIPLLFETGEDKKMDWTICVSASKKTQKERVLARKNMTKEKFRAILASQMPDAEKRRRADFVIKTDKGFAEAKKQVQKIWEKINA